MIFNFTLYTVASLVYCIAGKFAGGKFDEFKFTLFKHLVKESLAN